MATTGPIGFDVTHLRQEVLATYDDGAAREPEGNGRFSGG